MLVTECVLLSLPYLPRLPAASRQDSIVFGIWISGNFLLVRKYTEETHPIATHIFVCKRLKYFLYLFKTWSWNILKLFSINTNSQINFSHDSTEDKDLTKSILLLCIWLVEQCHLTSHHFLWADVAQKSQGHWKYLSTSSKMFNMHMFPLFLCNFDLSFYILNTMFTITIINFSK